MSAAAGQTSGTLRINTLGMAARQIIAPRLGRFHRAHPEVVLDIVVDDGLSDIVAGRFDAGIRVGHIGKSSVRYEIGLFDQGAPMSAAVGHFVHVYVDRATRRPVPLPEAFVKALQALQLPAEG